MYGARVIERAVDREKAPVRSVPPRFSGRLYRISGCGRAGVALLGVEGAQCRCGTAGRVGCLDFDDGDSSTAPVVRSPARRRHRRMRGSRCSGAFGLAYVAPSCRLPRLPAGSRSPAAPADAVPLWRPTVPLQLRAKIPRKLPRPATLWNRPELVITEVMGRDRLVTIFEHPESWWPERLAEVAEEIGIYDVADLERIFRSATKRAAGRCTTPLPGEGWLVQRRPKVGLVERAPREGQVVAEGAGSSRWWSSWWRTAHQDTVAAGQVDVAGGPASLYRSPISQPGERPPRPATRRLVGWGPGPGLLRCPGLTFGLDVSGTRRQSTR